MKYRRMARHWMLEAAIQAANSGFNKQSANRMARMHGAERDLSKKQLEELQAAMRKEAQAMLDKAVEDGVVREGGFPWFYR